MTAHHSITPSTQILDVNGYDWAWAFVWFRPVPDFPAYQAGSNGSVWSCYGAKSQLTDRWRLLKGGKHNKGHIFYLLCRDGKVHRRYGHHIILESFVGPCPPGMETCHFPDWNPANNALCNIRWDTRQANKQDCIRHGHTGRGEKNPNAKLSAEQVKRFRELLAAGRTGKSLAKEFGIAQSHASRINRGESWPDGFLADVIVRPVAGVPSEVDVCRARR